MDVAVVVVVVEEVEGDVGLKVIPIVAKISLITLYTGEEYYDLTSCCPRMFPGSL